MICAHAPEVHHPDIGGLHAASFDAAEPMRAFWRERGADILVWTQLVEGTVRTYAVRSDLVAGLPKN
jgi:hypothetical protein